MAPDLPDWLNERHRPSWERHLVWLLPAARICSGGRGTCLVGTRALQTVAFVGIATRHRSTLIARPSREPALLTGDGTPTVSAITGRDSTDAAEPGSVLSAQCPGQFE